MSTGESDGYTIAIVVADDFTDRLRPLAERMPVWIAGTPANRAAAKNLPSVEILRPTDGWSNDQECESFFSVVLNTRRVTSHDPPMSAIEVYGATLTDRLRAAFAARGFPFFTDTSDGFVARSRRAPGLKRKGPPKPFGLACSGGGFRATAFHLGVLKRLRELNLLEQIDFVSTVSGGSVAGAYWVHCQGRGDTIHNDDEWNRFETSLIRFMMFGVREWVVRIGFVAPLAALLAVALIVLPWRGYSLWPATREHLRMGGVVIAVCTALAYAVWHYLGARLYEFVLNRELFKGAILHDLSGKATAPLLLVNATGLNAGDHLIFSPQPAHGSPGRHLLGRVLPDTSGIPKPAWKRQRIQHRDLAPRVSLGLSTPMARAVAASCALPGVFAPLSIPDPQPWWEAPPWWRGRFTTVDGGVKDNQGTQVLMDGHCRGMIVSDAAAALRTVPRPSTWQLFPPGKGVVFRSQDIIYERMRDLGYQLLEERYDFSCRLEEAGLQGAAEDAGVALLDGYCYVELWPSDRFEWRENQARLPDAFVSFVASIRTDLDRFSAIEISALMFHGYTLIDHCIRAYHPDWLPPDPPPLGFDSPVKAVAIDWTAQSDDERADCISHLAMSDSRTAWHRRIGRRWFRRKAQRMARADLS